MTTKWIGKVLRARGLRGHELVQAIRKWKRRRDRALIAAFVLLVASQFLLAFWQWYQSRYGAPVRKVAALARPRPFQLDRNADSRLDAQEWSLLKEQFDRDFDSRLSNAEISDLHECLYHSNDLLRARVLDKNGDGKVEPKEEFQYWMSLDKNKDGVLSDAELKAGPRLELELDVLELRPLRGIPRDAYTRCVELEGTEAPPSSPEYRASRVELGTLSRDEQVVLRDAFDTDSDGILVQTEISDALEFYRLVMGKFDLNSNGRLGKLEIARAAQVLDANGDRQLSPEEARRALNQLRSEAKAAPAP